MVSCKTKEGVKCEVQFLQYLNDKKLRIESFTIGTIMETRLLV